LLSAFAITGCNKSTDAPSSGATAGSASAPKPADAATASDGGMEADLQKTLKAEADFYVFKTPADFEKETKNLKWDDGSDLPEFADLNAKKGGTLNEWIPDFPGTLRTIGPDATDSFRQYLLDYNELTFIAPHPNLPGKYYPQLAGAFAVDVPNKTVYFKIAPHAVWSDGVPVTTDDVVFSWYFYRSPNLTEPWYNDFFHKTYTRLTVFDKETFAVTVPEAKPDMVDRAGDVSLFPKHAFGDFGPGWLDRHNWTVTPTTGAYTVRPEDIKKQISVTLTHVPNWWAANNRFMRGRYNPDKVRCIVVRDPNKAFEEALRGDLDIFPVNIPNVWYDKLSEKEPSIASGFSVKAQIYNVIPVPNMGLWINESKPILNNHDVRLGIQYATNFALVCQQFFRGAAVQQQTASDGYGWNVNPDVHPRPFDPAKAREAFAKAGFTHQGPDGILANEKGERLSFTITNVYKRYEDLLAILKQEALKAGLEFNIETPDATTAFQKVLRKQHEIALAALSRSVEAYPRYWEMYSSDNAYDQAFLPDGSVNPNRKVKTDTNNFNSVAILELDKLIKRYDQASSMDEIKDLAAKMEKIIWDDAGWVPGWKNPFIRVMYRPWIKWPADFMPKRSLDSVQNWTMWIDEDEKKADLAAHAAGKALPVQIKVYDKWKEQ
jgi:microcin C transport system substrate-binding protein